MSFVEIKNFEKSFGDTKVLKNLSLNIEEGEFITLLGPVRVWKEYSFKMYSRA